MRALGLVLIVLLAGCGSKGGEPGGFETPDKDGNYYVIHLTASQAFDPAKAQVPPNAFVRFHFGLANCDVRSEEPGGPDSRGGAYANGIYPRDGTFNWIAPSQPAEFNIYCSAHQGMTGILRVG